MGGNMTILRFSSAKRILPLGSLAVLWGLTYLLLLPGASLQAQDLPQTTRSIPFGAELTIINPATANQAPSEKFTAERELPWGSFRNLTSERYGELFSEYRSRGWMLIDVEAYTQGRQTRYAMVWRDNYDGRQWRQWRNMTSDRYNERWTEMREAGFRPTDVEGYMMGRNLRFAGIWVENREGIRWKSNRNMTTDRFGELHAQRQQENLRPVDIEAYETPGGLRWAAIWYADTDDVDWTMRTNMTRAQYQSQVNALGRRGYQVRDYESYTENNQLRYAAIWERRADMPMYQLRTSRNDQQFRNLWNAYRDRGYRLADFEADPNGSRYSGVWVENNTRLRYTHREAIDGLVNAHRSAVRAPGISVAIIHNGETVYRRGFGDANPSEGHGAHSQTVYSAASVSKVFGATLAAHLEDEGRLSNDRRVRLDMTRPTRQYLNRGVNGRATLPAHHTHTVEQLTAHLGCVVHYPRSRNSGTIPGISNSDMVAFYPSALQASTALWNTGLVQTPTCTVGSNRVYSTHAFTLLGAVLEQVSGRPIHRLVREEINASWGLPSVRSQFETASLQSNRERATPHNSSGNAFNYVDSSWKVLGGGLEMHTLDMARFGWRLLNGDIVRDAVRDNRLWTPLAAGCSFGSGGRCSNGVGWRLLTQDGHRIAEHGGFGSGARTHLRIYPDDGLVIAVMINQAYSSDLPNPSVLVRQIGNVIL